MAASAACKESQQGMWRAKQQAGASRTFEEAFFLHQIDELHGIQRKYLLGSQVDWKRAHTVT